jgi:hypothetical protein
MLLEGKSLNLRIAEKEDVPLIAEWWSDSQYMGEYQDVMTKTLPEFSREILLESK